MANGVIMRMNQNKIHFFLSSVTVETSEDLSSPCLLSASAPSSYHLSFLTVKFNLHLFFAKPRETPDFGHCLSLRSRCHVLETQ